MSELEFDFFADEETAEVAAPAASRHGGGVPPEVLKRRRLVAAGIAAAIVLIVIVVLLTQSSNDRAGPYRTYLSRLSPVAADSAETGRLLTNLFARMRSGVATTPLATLKELIVRAQRDLAHAQAIRPPAELSSEHEQALTALEFRVTGLMGLHDAIGTSLGSTSGTAEAAIATQIDRLTTSDVVWARWVWRPIAAALTRLHIRHAAAPRSQFLTDIDTPAPASIAALLSPTSGTGGTALSLGATGAAVKAWQRRLNRWLALKHEKQLTPDGTFGPGTQAATEALQRAQGLTPDGVVGPRTRQALTSALAATR